MRFRDDDETKRNHPESLLKTLDPKKRKFNEQIVFISPVPVVMSQLGMRITKMALNTCACSIVDWRVTCLLTDGSGS